LATNLDVDFNIKSPAFAESAINSIRLRRLQWEVTMPPNSFKLP